MRLNCDSQHARDEPSPHELNCQLIREKKNKLQSIYIALCNISFCTRHMCSARMVSLAGYVAGHPLVSAWCDHFITVVADLEM